MTTVHSVPVPLVASTVALVRAIAEAELRVAGLMLAAESRPQPGCTAAQLTFLEPGRPA